MNGAPIRLWTQGYKKWSTSEQVIVLGQTRVQVIDTMNQSLKDNLYRTRSCSRQRLSELGRWNRQCKSGVIDQKYLYTGRATAELIIALRNFQISRINAASTSSLHKCWQVSIRFNLTGWQIY